MSGSGARSRLLSVAWKAVAALALGGVVLLVVGFLLPGRWSAERSVTIAAPPTAVWEWIAEPARWERWTALGQIQMTPSGPPTGVGATMTWDDPFMGDGSFTVTSAEPPRSLEYRVEVEGGSMTTEGSFLLEEEGGAGTRVVWRESGDFGRNPLMGFAALRMEEIQGTELERALARLRALAETGRLPDSLQLPAAVPGVGPDAGPATPRPSTPG